MKSELPDGVHEIAFDSLEYRASLELRDLFLRQALGLSLSSSDLDGEEQQRHFVAVESGVIVGCVVLKRHDQNEARVRQMVIAPERRGTGLGVGLMQVLESVAKSIPVERLVLHSRDIAVGFYEKLGFKKTSEFFEEVGIPHVTMTKELLK